MTRYQSPGNVAALIDAVASAEGNLRMAVNGCHEADMPGLLRTADRRLGLILLGYPGSARADVHGQARLGLKIEGLAERTEPQILDSEYVDWNDIALDLAYLGWKPQAPPLLNRPPGGNVEVDAQYRDGRLVGASLHPGQDGSFKIRCSEKTVTLNLKRGVTTKLKDALRTE